MNLLTNKLKNDFAIFFLCLSAIVSFVPFSPLMPTSGSESSWHFALNQALAQGLVFGRNIIFTFGPYSAIYTTAYHPATDGLMLCGSFFLAISYVGILLLLARNVHFYWLLSYGAFLAFFMGSRDALLFSYPLLLSLTIYRITLTASHAYKIPLTNFMSIGLCFLFAPLGLLPLIKSSMILVSAVTIALCCSILVFTKHTRLALAILILPLLTMVFLWVVAKQPILALPDFFISAQQIISGYTDAMSLVKTKAPYRELLYIITGIFILHFILQSPNQSAVSKFFLFLIYAFFLFIVFKAGFVRNDLDHAYIAGTWLVISLLSITFVTGIPGRRLVLLTAFSFIAIGELYPLHNAYLSTWQGIQLRLSGNNALMQAFSNSKNKIQKKYSIPALQGTVDIYPYHQAYLLASNNHWAPRPVLQSYSAYTEPLAALDAAYLVGSDAPDNILFSVKTIDGRLPALDDGASWPALISHYQVESSDHQFAYLKKRSLPTSTSSRIIFSKTASVNEVILIPDSNTPLFAKITIAPTSLGKLLALLYRLPRLDIMLTTANGDQKKFRIISGMTKSGFILSPLIESTDDFVSLMSSQKNLGSKKVKSITIHPRSGGAIFWNKQYALELSSLE